ncbi:MULTISPECIES: TetR/AcrR family transcriptional regulator [Actinomadura]|uniref:TetR/AcrR family transcriptional regulator n=1 Tax=Actinomadura yumaensis TaxID=111807 RepID=A0ABW2CG12_9ACTN|nr:TetR/AcrR family transcriptional regulator [Actinomadura sp. J1-007]MWK35553.1 TetR family transcriptional regulator [Actinomadura sp. J1-007]
MPQNTDPIADSVWLRPAKPKRGRPQLSREEIVAAAIELLDAEGLDGLSMRRLAAHLSAGATSAYFYVANKDELLELAVDEIMGEVRLPDVGAVGWRAAAASLAGDLRAVLLRHPWMVALLGVRPAIGPQAMRMSDRMVEVLTAAGFAGADLARASSLLTSHAIGAATGDVALRTATARAGKTPSELVGSLAPYVARTAAEYPHYAAWWGENGSLVIDPDDSFAFGLDRLLDGLQSWLDDH